MSNNSETSALDLASRREALERLGKLGAYVAPAMILLVSSKGAVIPVPS